MKFVRYLALLVLCCQPVRAADPGTAADCGVKNRHLHVDAPNPDARGGRFSLRLHDFTSLSGNELLTWKLVGDSASTVVYLDSFGFEWTPPTTSSMAKGNCEVEVIQIGGRLEIDVLCHDLRSRASELTGYLNPPEQHFTCRLN